MMVKQMGHSFYWLVNFDKYTAFNEHKFDSVKLAQLTEQERVKDVECWPMISLESFTPGTTLESLIHSFFGKDSRVQDLVYTVDIDFDMDADIEKEK